MWPKYFLQQNPATLHPISQVIETKCERVLAKDKIIIRLSFDVGRGVLGHRTANHVEFALGMDMYAVHNRLVFR
jgi:hypothetical protein